MVFREVNNISEACRESNGSVIPERLKNLLWNHVRECASRHDEDVSEKSEDDHWSLSWSCSEWSGYHDEVNCYTMTTTVTDQEPTLESNEHRIVNFVPSNRDRWQAQLPGYLIADYFETIIQGKEWCNSTNRSYIRLDGLPRPLWIISETVHSR